jgi:hypothetical protein
MMMAAQEDSFLSPITAAADRSESTTLLVSEGSGLPRVLQQAFHPSLELVSESSGCTTPVQGSLYWYIPVRTLLATWRYEYYEKPQNGTYQYVLTRKFLLVLVGQYYVLGCSSTLYCTQPPPRGGDQAVMPTPRGRRHPPSPQGGGDVLSCTVMVQGQKTLLCWDHRLNDVLFSVDKADALC